MKSKLSFVLIIALLIVFCSPGLRGEINPYFQRQLNLPSLAAPQGPVVYNAGYGTTSSFGIKLFGGLTSGNVRYPEVEGSSEVDQYKKSLSGLAAGIGFLTGGQIGAEVDIMYVQKGFKFKGTNVDDGQGGQFTFDADIMINQVAVPVMLRLSFMPGSSPYVLLGGEVSYVISAQAKYTVRDNLGNQDSDTQNILKDEETGEDLEILSRLDYSVVGGAGFELIMSTMRFYFEARYVLGMANIIHESQRADASAEFGAGNDWWKLSTILFMAGIGF